ncbi:MAG: hypothetical protein GY941_16395 [Planctomycetes bacterium]|nr:hypothetical protein [Planctomycetota bacterium]
MKNYIINRERIMAEQYTGVVKKAFEKNGRYSLLMDNDVWYSHGYVHFPEPVVNGATIRFNYETNGDWKNIVEGSFKVKPGAPAPIADTTKPKRTWGGGGNKVKDKYWEDKAIADIGTQQRISFQAAFNTSIAMLNGALAAGVYTIPGAKKNAFEAYCAIIKAEAETLYRMYQLVPEDHEERMKDPEDQETLPADMDVKVAEPSQEDDDGGEW